MARVEQFRMVAGKENDRDLQEVLEEPTALQTLKQPKRRSADVALAWILRGRYRQLSGAAQSQRYAPCIARMWIDDLEQRHLLSTTAASWPAAPFPDTSVPMIYVNQFGDALLTGQSLANSRDFNAYRVFFDDVGPLTLSAVAKRRLQLAFYDRPGRPGIVNADVNTPCEIRTAVPKDMRTLSIGLRSFKGRSRYALKIDGPPVAHFEKLSVSKVTNSGANGSEISRENDIDYYRFRVPRTGNWIVKVIPDKAKGDKNRLDATFNVYDSAGRPIGGSFTHPIDSHKAGGAEIWKGIGLRPGRDYYIRVDGAADSMGGYGVSVFLMPVTDVKVSVPASTANSPNQFIFTRTDNSSSSLTIKYAVSGTAVAGADYAPFSGALIIPANHTSASLTIRRLSASTATKSIVLSLLPDRSYNIAPPGKAVVVMSR